MLYWFRGQTYIAFFDKGLSIGFELWLVIFPDISFEVIFIPKCLARKSLYRWLITSVQRILEIYRSTNGITLLQSLLSLLLGLVLWSCEPHDPPLTALVAAASGLQCWPDSVPHELACFRVGSRIGTATIRRESRRKEFSITARGPLFDILIDWALSYLPLLVRSAIEKKSGSSHL